MVLPMAHFFSGSVHECGLSEQSMDRPNAPFHTMSKRGAVRHRWWWEQQMDLDIHHALGSDDRREMVQSMPYSVVRQRGSGGTIGLIAGLLPLFRIESTSVTVCAIASF